MRMSTCQIGLLKIMEPFLGQWGEFSCKFSLQTGYWDNTVLSRHSQRSEHQHAKSLFSFIRSLQEPSLLSIHTDETSIWHWHPVATVVLPIQVRPWHNSPVRNHWTLGIHWHLQRWMDWWSLHSELAGCSILCYPAPILFGWKHAILPFM